MQFTVPYLQFCTFTFAHAFLGISCAQTVVGLVLVLVLAVATAGSVPLSTLVVGAEASYASTPRGGRLSGQAAKLGRWWRARKNGDWFRTLQSRKSQYCSQYTCINVLQRVEIYCPEYARRRTTGVKTNVFDGDFGFIPIFNCVQRACARDRGARRAGGAAGARRRAAGTTRKLPKT
jgi:hypothetical protein